MNNLDRIVLLAQLAVHNAELIRKSDPVGLDRYRHVVGSQLFYVRFDFEKALRDQAHSQPTLSPVPFPDVVIAFHEPVLVKWLDNWPANNTVRDHRLIGVSMQRRKTSETNPIPGSSEWYESYALHLYFDEGANNQTLNMISSTNCGFGLFKEKESGRLMFAVNSHNCTDSSRCDAHSSSLTDNHCDGWGVAFAADIISMILLRSIELRRQSLGVANFHTVVSKTVPKSKPLPYYILNLDKPRQPSKDTKEKNAEPSWHITYGFDVRSHTRHYANGKTVPVKSYRKGKNLEYVPKTYHMGGI